jgi:hypothetical protein
VLVDPRFRTWAQRAGRFADHTFQGTPLALEWLAGEVARDVQAGEVEKGPARE